MPCFSSSTKRLFGQQSINLVFWRLTLNIVYFIGLKAPIPYFSFFIIFGFLSCRCYFIKLKSRNPFCSSIYRQFNFLLVTDSLTSVAIRRIHRGSNLLDLYILYTFKNIYFFTKKIWRMSFISNKIHQRS